MPSRELASQLWLTALLATLSVTSVIIIVEDEARPGHAPRERPIPTQAAIDELNTNIHSMLRETQDWVGLCSQPLPTLLEKSRLAGRQLSAQDPSWMSRRQELAQWERDALTRCQAASQGKNDRICFHVASGPLLNSLQAGVWSSPMNLIEMRIEFHSKAGRVACDKLRNLSEATELLAYYTAYWEEEQPEGENAFKRVNGGLRFKLDPTLAQTAEPLFEKSVF